MRGGYHSLESVWLYLNGDGELPPIGLALLAMGVGGGLLLILARLYRAQKAPRRSIDLSGMREQLKAERTDRAKVPTSFDEAVELTTTGTIRQKSIEEKMVDCVLATEILFASVDHGIIYQFEMGEWSAQDVASWAEVVDALGLTELARIHRGVSAIHGVISHPDYDPDFASGEEGIGERLWHQATALHREFAAINGAEILRDAVIVHLQRTAPQLLDRLG